MTDPFLDDEEAIMELINVPDAERFDLEAADRLISEAGPIPSPMKPNADGYYEFLLPPPTKTSVPPAVFNPPSGVSAVPGRPLAQVVRDALRGAEAVRSDVVRSEFLDVPFVDGFTYEGISRFSGADRELKRAIEFGIDRRISIKLSFWRLALEGQLSASAVHADNLGTEWAAVYYLPPPGAPESGTAFWSWKGDPTMYFDEPGRPEAFYRAWNDIGQWNQAGYVKGVSNRLVVYPANLIHSRWPLEGYGSGPEDGRLVWVAFFDLEND